MQFNPSLEPISGIQPKESVISPEKEITIPVETAWPFQVHLFVTYFKDKNGEAVTPSTLDNEKIVWFAGVYGQAFRDYCVRHPDVSKQIILGKTEPEAIRELVTYMKAHPRTEEELAREYAADNDKYRVVH